jgi:CubicO group peptidase (beta-lactamase class C family)
MGMKKILGLLIVTVLAGTAGAQDFSGVDAWLTAKTWKMGGRAVLMVEKDGKIVYSRAVNDRIMGEKFTAQTRVRIASCSKWLSAALVMTFVDEGKLRLDDTVGQYLPVLSAHGKGGITVRQCLSHLTGIKEPPLRESLIEMSGDKTMRETIEQIAEMPVEGAPGTVFRYSNAGLQIAGAILEKISGQQFGQLFLARIATPLGMTNTDFGNRPVAFPAGGAFSTAEDYMRFLEMIRNKGVYHGTRILSEHSVEEMEKNWIGADVRVGYSPAGAAMGQVGYGYGEWTMGPGVVSSPGLFGAFPWVDNGRGYSAFLMVFYVGKHKKQERDVELMRRVNAALQ